jgi:hypothetical protein
MLCIPLPGGIGVPDWAFLLKKFDNPLVMASFSPTRCCGRRYRGAARLKIGNGLG